ncbi:MAG: thioredoxin family protein [Bacteroidaceae bacterium]|nr:thioredoxin family protein [Bacteroidaceae bacterium]
MKRTLTTMLSLMVGLTLMAQGMVFEPEGTTLEQAAAKAKAENKLVFMDCYTQWCGPCKKMAKDVFTQEMVGAYMNPKFVNIKVDMESDYGTPLAKKLQITAYPTFVIFNGDAKEVGRFLGSSDGVKFIENVGKNSMDTNTSDLEQRFKSGDRDPQFLQDYLKTLTASYKVDDANDVAEAILEGKEETFAMDPELAGIFMKHINNPFSKPFKQIMKTDVILKGTVGSEAVDMKVQNVLTNYMRKLVVEKDGTASLDQANYDAFVKLTKDAGMRNANHFKLTPLILLAEKQKDYDSYLKYIKEYLSDNSIDANDMQLANWVKPFADPAVDSKYKQEMKQILLHRIEEIKKGNRQPMTKIGNMTLSRPTDELLGMLVDAMDGKMPNQQK